MLLNKHKRVNSRKNSAKEGICDLEDQTEELSQERVTNKNTNEKVRGIETRCLSADIQIKKKFQRNKHKYKGENT